MAAAQDNTAKIENREETTITIKLNDFVQKNRKGLLFGLLAVVVILAAFIAGLSIRDKMRENALTQVDALNVRYEALRIFIGSEEPDAAAKQADIDTLLADLEAFTRKNNSGFAAARANALSASIYEAQKKWQEAGVLWTAAAKAAENTYFEPVAVFNAAVAVEEQGNIPEAIALYTEVLSHESDFPSAARAQFAIGRLEESRNDKAAALTAYRNLVSRWPTDPVWSNLAQSRIVVLDN